jgi:cyclic pyranopterin phosphate synthase
MSRLSHLDAGGRARMVDVSAKDQTERTATAKGAIFLQAATLDAIVAGELPKGDVFAVARVAGIMAAKRTSDVIPLCHPLPITGVMIELSPDKARSTVEISATVKVTGRTGVEMEALTAVSTAALTIYDMCKAIDRGMVIGEIRLVSKAGGRSGTFVAT